MSCGIYGIHNMITDKWYVGQASNIKARWNAHRSLLNRNQGESIHLLRAWNKYGAEAFEWVILELCKEEELDEREVFWIAEKDSFKNGYNRTIGGGGIRGYQLSDSHKAKIGEKTSEKWRDKEHKEKRLAAMHAVMDTEEYRKKLSEAGKRNWSDPTFKNLSLERMRNGAMAPEAKKRWKQAIEKASADPQTKKKISAASRRNWSNELYRKKVNEAREKGMNEEYKKKISARSKENWKDAGYRKRVSTNLSNAKRDKAKKILQVETGTVFSCIAEAAEALNISHAHISSACKGVRKTAGGFHWCYADESQEKWQERRRLYLIENCKKEYSKVVCIETGEVFEHIKDAAEQIGVHPSNITKVCHGDQLSAGGFHWRYLNEPQELEEKRQALLFHKEKSKKNSGQVKVLCVETNTLYDSLTDASNALNINRSGISNALRGKTKTAGGYHWRYFDKQ